MNPEHPQFTAGAAPEGMLNVLSVFLTIDGETNYFHQGTWSTFVRLTGCRVGCHWCDTKYSWSIKQGKVVTPHNLVKRVLRESRGCRKVTITGGEPLEQDPGALITFIHSLLQYGYFVTIETAGTDPISPLRLEFDQNRVNFVVDYKCASAKIIKPVMWENYQLLTRQDVVKFVVASREDFDEALGVAMKIRNLHSGVRMVMSPINVEAGTDSGGAGDSLYPSVLLRWMKEECPALGIGINMQLHKYIWVGNAREEEGEASEWEHLR